MSSFTEEISKKGHSLCIPKPLIFFMGLRQAVFYIKLVRHGLYIKKKYGKERTDFFYSGAKFEQEIDLSAYEQKKAIELLQEMGFLEIVGKGKSNMNKVRLNFKISDHVISFLYAYWDEIKKNGLNEAILKNLRIRHHKKFKDAIIKNLRMKSDHHKKFKDTLIKKNINKEKINKMPAGQAGRANFENSSFSDEEIKEEIIEQSIKKEKKKLIKEKPTLASLSQRTTLLGTKQKEMTFHQKCAKKLIEVVHEVFHSNNSTSFANWAKEFEKLERINQIEPERIDKVLSYFCEDLKEKKKQGKGSILSYSAGQFRKNFIMIEQFMEQKEDRAPKKIELDKEGKMTLDGLAHLEWPKGAAARLPEAIQKSQKGLTQFIELNEALASKAPNGIAGLPFTTEVRVAGFARVVKGKMVSRIAKLKAYYEIIHERVKNWKNWNGRFDSYILEYKNPIFQDTYLKVLAAERWGKETEFLFGEYVKSLEELEAKADNNEKQA